MKTLKITESTHKKLENAKIIMDVVTFDNVIDLLCSKSNLYFLKNYEGSNEEDIRNYIAGLFKNTDKYIQKQVGRPMARFADFEKMYWHRLVHLDKDFENLNFKLDTILRVAKKEIGIQPNDDVDDFQNSINLKEKADVLEANQLEKHRSMLELSERTNDELQNKIRELISQINFIVPKFKKKDGMFGGKTQFDLTLNEEEYKGLVKCISL